MENEPITASGLKPLSSATLKVEVQKGQEQLATVKQSLQQIAVNSGVVLTESRDAKPSGTSSQPSRPTSSR